MVNKNSKNQLNIILNDKIIKLVPISLKYLMDFHEYSSDKKFYKYFEYKEFGSLKKSKDYLKHLIKKSKKNDFQSWFIILKNEEKCIGTITCILNNYRDSSELGYGINPKYWRNGYFSRALRIVKIFLFKKIKLKRIFAITFYNNQGSIKPLLKLGFKKEGILRSYYKVGNKKYTDGLILSKINK